MKCPYCGEKFVGVISRTAIANAKQVILIGCPKCKVMLGAVSGD